MTIKRKTAHSVFIAFFSMFMISACSTIEFVQHQQNNQLPPINRWHHSTLNGMVELSKPLNVREICGQKAWTSITTEFSFYNSLAVLLVPSTNFVSLYSAWTNRVKCYEVSDDTDNL